MKLAKKLRLLKGGMSQSELSRQLGISQTAVSNYFNAEGEPGVTNALKLANFFGVDVQWLFDDSKGTEDPKTPGVSLSDRQLVTEVARRAAARIEALERVLLQAGRFDWAGFAEEIQAGGHWSEVGEDGQVRIAHTKLGAALNLATAMGALVIFPTYKLIKLWYGDPRTKDASMRIVSILDALKSKWPAQQAYSDALGINNDKLINLDADDYVDYLERLVRELRELQLAEA